MNRELVVRRTLKWAAFSKKLDSRVVMRFTSCEVVRENHPKRANDVPWKMCALSKERPRPSRLNTREEANE